jgi:ankyrin repeat protein
MKHEFKNAYTSGNFDIIKNIIAEHYININSHCSEGFMLVCEYGHTHIIEYLVNLYKTTNCMKLNIHLYDELGFRWACAKGHIQVIKYLINLYKIDKNYDKININIDNGDILCLAFSNGKINVMKYLIKLYKINTDYHKININGIQFFRLT